MPTECSRDLFGYEVVAGRQVVAGFDGGEVTSDAGALLLGAANRAIGLVRRLAGCFTDGRAPELVEHTVETMLMQRICGVALGYEDLVDHDELRHDPVLAAVAGKLAARRKDCAPLAGKSTLNRLEALRRIGLRHTQFARATCGTIRLKLLKIGAQVRKSVRRIKVAMASACPYQTGYHLAYLYLKRAAF